jgi:hypothetical protein
MAGFYDGSWMSQLLADTPDFHTNQQPYLQVHAVHSLLNPGPRHSAGLTGW